VGFEQFESWEFELNDFIAEAQAAEDAAATERYVDSLIDQGREDEPVYGMPAWWHRELYGKGQEE
jgi:hypothetical protein